jgi:hypothetical protein
MEIELYKKCINAKYGIGNHLIDVTEIVDEKFIKNNIVFIPDGCHFNKYFEDPSLGNMKFLILQINDKKHILREGTITSNLAFPINIYHKKVTIVYYAFINPHNNWEIIISDQLIHLSRCGLLDIAEIHIHVTGLPHYHDYVTNLIKTIIPDATIYLSIENQYEYPGIHLVWELANKKPDNIFLYFHSKGMSYPTLSRRHDERQIFQEVILPWRKVLNIFRDNNEIDKVGFGSSKDGFMWFNFWWARGSYLIGCEEPIVSDNRWYYEVWVANTITGKPRTCADCFSLADDVIGQIYTGDDVCGKINAIELKS